MEEILEKIESAFDDMSAHLYNGYTDDSEYSLRTTVRELELLRKLIRYAQKNGIDKETLDLV